MLGACTSIYIYIYIFINTFQNLFTAYYKQVSIDGSKADDDDDVDEEDACSDGEKGSGSMQSSSVPMFENLTARQRDVVAS